MSANKWAATGLLLVLGLFPARLRGVGQADRPEPVSSSPVEHRPAWLREGVIAAAYVEPLSYCIRRGGGPAGLTETWKADFNETVAQRYKEMGVNLVILNLHKGAGLEAEAEDIAVARRFAEILRRHGIKVGGYVGSSMLYETFYREEPSARQWEQVTERGQPVYYGYQTFRRLACRNHPGYQAFVQKVLRLGVRDLKMDLMHFDQMMWWGEPWSCRCQYCRELFREFVRRRYPTPESMRLRFGFPRMEIMPPIFNLDAPPVRIPELADPMMQEWARFRCATLAQRYGELHNYIYRLNPEATLEGNPTMAPGINGGFAYGLDMQLLLQHGQLICNEEANHPRWTDDNRLVSLIRTFKIARVMNKSLMIEQDPLPESPEDLRFAETMAYNDMCLGIVAGLPEYGGRAFTPGRKRNVDFFRSNRKELADTRPVADAAVLRSFASVQFNPAKGLVGAVLAEQTMIQNKIPFDIIFDMHLKELGRYKVLVLADQDALGDEQLEQIRQYVRGGGGLVATGESSLLNDWRLRRAKFGLWDLYGIETPPGRDAANRPMRREVGKGRVAYLPRLEPAAPPPPAQMTYHVTNEHFRLPKNWKDLVDAVEWAAKGEYSVQVDAPLWVTMELAEQKGTGARLLHLLNFKVNEPVTNVAVRMRIPQGKELGEVVVRTPDEGPAQEVKPTVRDGVASFTVPRLNVYDLVLLRMRAAR